MFLLMWLYYKKKDLIIRDQDLQIQDPIYTKAAEIQSKKINADLQVKGAKIHRKNFELQAKDS